MGIVAAVGVSWLQPTLYSANSTGYVVAGNSATVGDAFAGKNLAAEKAATYLPLVQSRSVAERIAKDMGLASISEIAGQLKASNDGVIFHITATASSPELAARLADSAIQATSVEANALETMTLTGENSDQTVVRIVPVELAQTPTKPVSPDWTRNLIIGPRSCDGRPGSIVARHSLTSSALRVGSREITKSSVPPVPKATELVGGADHRPNRRRRGSAETTAHQPRFVSGFCEEHRCDFIKRERGQSTIAANLAVLRRSQPTF